MVDAVGSEPTTCRLRVEPKQGNPLRYTIDLKILMYHLPAQRAVAQPLNLLDLLASRGTLRHICVTVDSPLEALAR